MANSAHPSRRTFLKRTAIGAAAVAGAAGIGTSAYWIGSRLRAPKGTGKKVIVIGIDGMDPGLCELMINGGGLKNLARLREQGGFNSLGTSIPPQSPVAWASFINGAGPGSHGIFDFIHRHPHEQCKPFYAAAETVDGNTLLRRQGTPFWDYLDAAGIPSTFYDLPSNYPPSPSQHGHSRCISGMGTPDMRGTYGTYQLFAEDGHRERLAESGGERCQLTFTDESATGTIIGPEVTKSGAPHQLTVDFEVHRDRQTDAAVIEVQGRRIPLNAGDWSEWTKLVFEMPWYTANITGIVRFYLQEVTPNLRLYVSPVNMDPARPLERIRISEPADFIERVSRDVGPFATTGFQEDYSARKNGVFDDDEYLRQAGLVLQERLKLFDHAVESYEDGLLFFYFSSCDLQSHMFWWDSADKHPIRSPEDAGRAFSYVWKLYETLDRAIGKLMERFGSQATIFVMSDHGFANFGRQFNLNSWLRDIGYLNPGNCTSIMRDVDWSITYAYGLGINGLYLNKKGRERDGIVEPGEVEERLNDLKDRLESLIDVNGQRVISNVYRADQVYSGNALELAPDLIVGYSRGYRASWATVLGDLTEDCLLDNDSPWSADHCADALEVPGVLFCNRPLRAKAPALMDLAPSILAEFGLPTPSTMTGTSILA